MKIKAMGKEYEFDENPYSFTALIQSNMQNFEHWLLGKEFDYTNIPVKPNTEGLITYLKDNRDMLKQMIAYTEQNELYYDAETLDNFVQHSHVVTRLSGFKNYIAESIGNRQALEEAADKSYVPLLKEVLDLTSVLNDKIDIRIKEKDYISRGHLQNMWSLVLLPFIKPC